MRRKQYIDWLAGTFGVFATVYGGYMLHWHFSHGNGLNVLALVLLILGIVALTFFIPLIISRYIFYIRNKKKAESQVIEQKEEEKQEEEKEEVKVTSTIKEEVKVEPKKEQLKDRVEYVRSKPHTSHSIYDAPTIYIRQVGYGYVLRIEGNRILDMRNNTYYRIQDNIVYEDGSGPRYEINGNMIRSAFGGYLYELSGNNINKIYGGFYASISGNYITLYDLSVKYELSSSLSRSQILAAIALLFGE